MTGLNLVIVLIIYAVLSTAQMYRKSLMIKLAAVTYMFAVASVVYFSFETYKGWATTDRPTKGDLISVYIVDPRGKNPGAIYFWVVSKQELGIIEKIYTYVPGEEASPRAHSLPYNKKAAAKFREAQQALEDGMMVSLESMEQSEGRGEPSASKPGDKKGDEKDGSGGDVEEYDVPHFKIEDPSQRLEKQQ
jgi:hypothetical protein